MFKNIKKGDNVEIESKEGNKNDLKFKGEVIYVDNETIETKVTNVIHQIYENNYKYTPLEEGAVVSFDHQEVKARPL